MPQVPGLWSKNIFGDTTFRTSCCKSSGSGSGWATCKTHLWSSVARLGMPQADQTSCSSFVETFQHLQRVVPVGSGARRIYGDTCRRCDMGLPCLYFHRRILSAHSFTFCPSLNTGLCLMVLPSPAMDGSCTKQVYKKYLCNFLSPLHLTFIPLGSHHISPACSHKGSSPRITEPLGPPWSPAHCSKAAFPSDMVYTGSALLRALR